MTPDSHAQTKPQHPAVTLGSSGEVMDFATLSARSKHLAWHMAAAGLKAGDHIAVLLENRREYFEICWAAQRMGLLYTPVNRHLQTTEVAYIVSDSGARWVFVSHALAHLVPQQDAPRLERVVLLDDDGSDSYAALMNLPMNPTTAAPTFDMTEQEGQPMYYSSGTTGRPKGIQRDLPTVPFGGAAQWESVVTDHYSMDASTVYLSPAPLYHAAPLAWSMMVQRRGGSVIVMERFDPLQALCLIEKHRVTHLQMVPTHFVQMLKLPASERLKFDMSSLRVVVHAAAPCPVAVKEQMLAWWGPIVHEYYGFSEGSGMTRIGPQEWLAHKGSVGRATLGTIRILDEQGLDVPTGEAGVIWFENGRDFKYHNDPAKTAAAHDAQGRTSVGDMGYVDAEGYLYLTDRVSHMIISGGVNIYPQELESALTLHPAVADVGVIGLPDAEFGERVVAVVVAAAGVQAGPALEAELIAFSRSQVAHFKCPKQVIFASSLPRLPTGKLLKRQMKLQYATLTPLQ